MQINKISLLQPRSFKADIPPVNDYLKELYLKNNPDAVLKLSGQYPDFEATIIKQAQYDREKTARGILKESKNIEHDLFAIETRGLAILRFIKEGYSKWHHRQALETMKNSDSNNCKVNGIFYALKEENDEYSVTRLYDSATVTFDKEGRVLEVRQGDYLMRTEAYYSEEGKQKPFLTCDGYSEKEGVISAQRAYYTGLNSRCYKGFKIEKGKKQFRECFDFIQSERNLALKKYKNSTMELDLLDFPNCYKFSDLSSGESYSMKIS